MKTLLLLLALGLLAPAQTSRFFRISNGTTVCTGATVVSTLPKLNFNCSTPTGGISAGYSSSKSTDVSTFIFGIVPATCWVVINATGAAVNMGSFGTIPAKDVAYQCSFGTSIQSGLSPQVWP